jgi:hypothetical protein
MQTTNPENLRREVEILSEMGLENFEIQYLIYLKEKQELAEKWD